VIVAFAIFMLVKAANKLNEKPEKVAPADPEPGVEEKLLTEIRDLLKNIVCFCSRG
jgi:large conductance mechanosensitive channel